ncbi:MAG: FMN-binding protein [Spirochaetaceae bacterium]|nr:FMN-binding protein [Spirochaetaceae bacterium]MBP5792727.1 FMN-binding protein [Spirochaetaceae bacterium]
MKKFTLVLAVLILSGFIGFQIFSASIRKSLASLENAAINMNNIADGVYSGHSELGPVSVDVEVHVTDHKLAKVDLVQHTCGLGRPAEAITEKMVEQNTFDVDAVSGATVSSEVIKNAVNKALRQVEIK